MTTAVHPPVVSPGLRWKRIVLPPEHGAWGFLLEPIVVGLVLVPTWSGWFVALAALAAFLARNPLRIAMGDWRLGVRSTRTLRARTAAITLSSIAAALLVLALVTGELALVLPITVALPIALVQQRLEAMRKSRALAAELAGTIAAGAIASVIVLAGGASVAVAFALWLLLVCRSVPAVLYVRERIAIDKRGEGATLWPIVAHVVAVLIAAALLFTSSANGAAVVVLVMLLARCMWGLSRWHRKAHPARIGVAELVWGVVMVVGVVVG